MAVRYWGASYSGESGDTKPTAGSNTSGLEDGWLFIESDTDKIFVYDQSQTAWTDIVANTIGTSVQAYDAGLASIAGLSTAADKMIYTSGSDTYAVADLSSFARTVLDDANAGAVRTTLGLVIGTNVQAYDAQLADVAGLAVADGNFIVGDGSNFVVESANTASASLGLGTGNSPQFTGLTLTGDLTVSGTTTTINSTTLTVDDKNLELGSVASPSDTTADGGGITLKGASDKTIIWDNANDNWTSNQDWNIATGKVFKVNNVSTLTATALGSAVVGSSLTSVGTLTGLTVSGATTLNGNVTLGDAAADTVTIGGTIQGASPLIFEGGSANGNETTIAITDPTADRTITIPDETGTLGTQGFSISMSVALG